VSELRDNLVSLLGLNQLGNGRLPAAQTPDSINQSMGIGYLPSDEGGGSGTGVAWPLTETGRQTTTVRVQSSVTDLYVDVEVATRIEFEDADGRAGMINFAAPE
jgi:hypothetical protein